MNKWKRWSAFSRRLCVDHLQLFHLQPLLASTTSDTESPVGCSSMARLTSRSTAVVWSSGTSISKLSCAVRSNQPTEW